MPSPLKICIVYYKTYLLQQMNGKQKAIDDIKFVEQKPGINS